MRAMKMIAGGWAVALAVAGACVGLAVQEPALAAGAWSPEADCAACHTVEAAATNGPASPHALPACAACHDDESALVDAHKDVDASSAPPKKLKKAKIDAETCLVCHGGPMELSAQDNQATAAEKSTDTRATNDDAAKPADTKAGAASQAADAADGTAGWDFLAELTADSEVLVDAEGTVVNPHALPAGADHKNITCTDCHKVHAEADSAKAALTKCRSCHHEDIFECYTCHD